MNNKKRVLIYGFYGIENAGNEAMLRALCAPLTEHYGDNIEVVVAARHPSPDYDQRFGVRTIPNFEYTSREDSMGRWLRGLNPDDSEEYLQFINEVANADLVVLGPGQLLVETGTSGMLKGALGQTLAVVTACQLTSTPLYGLALACEDLKSAWGRLTIRQVLSAFADLTFRDKRSVDNIEAAEITLPDHAVLGDLALLSSAEPSDSAASLLQQESIPAKQGPRLAVALRRIYWLGLDEEAHRKKMAVVVARWIETTDGDAVFIPQNVYDIDGDRDDDRAEAEKTISLMPSAIQSSVHCINGKHDPAAIEAVYGLCDVTLSARLHGAVFSCKQGTPPVVLEFMDKTRGFFQRLGHPDCMIPLDASAQSIADKLANTLAQRDSISSSILKSVDGVRETAQGYVSRCIDLLEAPEQDSKAWAKATLKRANPNTDTN